MKWKLEGKWPISINDQVRHEEMIWPTPKNRDYRSPRGGEGEKRNNPDLNVTAYMEEGNPQKGQLNPAWVSLLMGFPEDWTEIGPQDGGPRQKQEATETHAKP